MRLLALAQMAKGQGVSSGMSTEDLIIRVSADGVCHFLRASTACNELGSYLLSRHLAQNGDIEILVDRASKYELIVSTLESLERAGFKKVGFLNKDFQ